MEQLNIFHKGMVSDLDQSKVQPDNWVYPTLNARVVNRDGQGYILVTMEGNKKQFQLSTGYEALAGIEHRGVLYVISIDNSTSPATVEFGSYPSIPAPGTYGFTDNYRPIKNMEANGTRTSFRAANLGYAISSRIDVFARDAYDGSTNLYLCDGVNPNYVYNTGISMLDSGYTQKTYDIADIPKLLKQFLVDYEIPTLSAFSIVNGGNLPFGNYFIGVRYLDRDYNRTSFVTTFGPFQIGAGTDVISVEGGDHTKNSLKLIELSLADLDIIYPFFELGVTRYFGDNNNQSSEQWLVSQKFLTNAGNNTVRITGRESTEVLSFADLIRTNEGITCRSHTHAHNNYWGLNWVGPKYDKEALRQFAARVKAGWSTTHQMDTTESNEDLKMHYKDYEEAHDHVGYFRGEAYPFALVAKLEDGSFSDAYPICGFDNYDASLVNPGIGHHVDSDGFWYDVGNNLTGANAKGVFRFPFYDVNYAGGDALVNDQSYVLGFKADFSDAWTYYLSQIAISPNPFEGISELYIVRGDRFVNLLYQGLRVPCVTYEQTEQPEKVMPVGLTDEDYPFVPISLISKRPLIVVDRPLTDHVFHGAAIVGKQTAAGNCGWVYVPGVPAISDPNGYTTQVTKNKIEKLTQSMDKYALIASDHYLEGVPSVWDEQVHLIDLFDMITPAVGKGKETTLPEYALLHPYNNQTIVNYIHNFGLNNGTLLVDSLINQWEDIQAESIEDYDNSVSTSKFSSFAENSETLVNYFMRDPEYVAHKAGEDGDGWDASVGDFDCVIGNRTMHTGKYIGLTYPSAKTYNAYNRQPKLTAIYRAKNDSAYMTTTVMTFNAPTAPYGPIGQLLSLDSNPGTQYYYQGDCYLQRNWRRIMHWHSKSPTNIWMYDSTDDGVEDANPGIDPEVVFRYEHGFMYGFHSECSKNSAMRYSDENRTFYPKSNQLTGNSPLGFVITGDEDVFIDEAGYYNAGYHRTRPPMTHLGADLNLDLIRRRYPTRVKHSNRNTPGAIVDGYRLIGVDSYRDFFAEKGEGVRLVSVGNTILMVQEHAVSELVINTQALTMPSSIGEVAVGSGSVLAQYVKPVAEFGSQHFGAVVEGAMGLYGFDLSRKIFWMITLQQAGMSFAYRGIDIGEKTANQWLIDTILNEMSINGTLVNPFVDDPFGGNGIVLGYNPRFKEIYLSFIKRAGEEYNDINRTIVFSELIQNIVGEASFAHYLYLRQLDTLIAPHYAPSQYWIKNGEMMLMHGGTPLNFNDVQYPWKFSVMVNGNVERENTSALTKMYQAWMAEMPEYELYRAYYQSEYQSSEQDLTASAPFYSLPIHSENRWNVPIDVQLSVQNHEMGTLSQMRGRAMKLTVEYRGSVFNFVRNLSTSYIISNR